MSASGWICSYRAIWEHPIFAGNAERVGVWDWMCKKAAWKPTRFKVNGKIITLDRGQLCVSHRQVCEETGISHQRLRTFLAELLSNKAITQDTTLGRTVITICNYGRYQDKDDAKNTGSNTAATQQQHTKEQGNTSTSSVSEETGASADVVSFDIRKVLFDTIPAALVNAGWSHKDARALVGKWLSLGHDEGRILSAYSEAVKHNASEPFTYMQRVLSEPAAAAPVQYAANALEILRERRRNQGK